MRIPFVAGNWKMNASVSGTEALIHSLIPLVKDAGKVDIAVCPPFLYVNQALALTKNTHIRVGAQNCWFESSGAFTGEVSPEMVKDAGCTYVIIGHSERRHILNETDEVIHKKIRKALAAGLVPIFCIGELLDEREQGKTEQVIERQVSKGLEGLNAADMKSLVIAYEPVWAIGTGRNATPEQAQAVHRYIREWLKNRFGAAVSDAVRIQYGGSVKPDNAKGLLSQPDIDGALVGGASLNADHFAAIVKAAVS
jgi:triosephosphate isomerase